MHYRVGDYQVKIRTTRPWTILGAMYGECKPPYTLNTTFVYFERVAVF